MDPLSALSVASSAIQLLDFGSKLWKQIRELYVSSTGTSDAYNKIMAEARRLRSLNSGLARLLAPDKLQRDLTPTEQAVVELCSACDDAAAQVVNELTKLSIGEDSSVGYRTGY